MFLFASLKRHAAALAAVSAVALGAAAASPAYAGPAVWVVKDKDSTIYLLGTIHVLKPDTQWRTPVIDKALAESADLWLEVEADDPAVMQPLILKYGVDPANPLSKKLSADDLSKLDAAAKGMGSSAAALDPMRPWLAGLTLSVVPMLKAGYDPASGIEAKLKAEAKAAGKPVRTLETAEQQIRFFADLPPALEMEFLKSALEDTADSPAVLDNMVKAWSAGDVEGLGKLMFDDMEKEYPDLYEVLLVKRNQDWAGQIDTLLDGKGVTVIAVGAGHLTGDDSLQAQLAKRGIKAKRLKD